MSYQLTISARHGYLHAVVTLDTMRFAEDVAVNRAFPVRVFPAVTAAGEWLREEVRRDEPLADGDTRTKR